MTDQYPPERVVENAESKSERVAELADEFAERFRRGERPPISEYIQRCPEAEPEIRDVFSAIAQVERLAPGSEGYRAANSLVSDPPQLEQLGDFLIIREVGRGGMGVVYEAEQISLARQVALKVLPKQVLLDPKHKQRFVREAKAAARLHHTNIVPVFGVGEQDGIQYYVMQFINGQGLDEILIELKRLREESLAGQSSAPTSQPDESTKQSVDQKSAHVVPEKDAVAQSVAQSLMSGRFERTVLFSNDENFAQVPSDVQEEHDTATGRLSDTQTQFRSLVLTTHSDSGSRGQTRTAYWQSVARIGQQAADALEYAHAQGIIHRDVKPGNLLLDNGGNVWVADFGLAKTADQQDLTQTGDILGTIRYMAPEQFDGKADVRSDVYSLGITLYEMLALQPAFDERDRRKLVVQVTKDTPTRLRTIDPTIPRDLETIVHKAIDRDPTHRYQSASELSADLERYLNDEPIQARWISPGTRFARWCKRNPAVAALTTTIAILLIASTIGACVAAYKFRELAENLNTTLGDANSNLQLATAEQQRAEANLDLALDALDAVYLDAIGEEKLLGRSALGPEGHQLRPPHHEFSELEKELIRRGLGFYELFAEQNAKKPRAGAHMARAYYRVAMLQRGLTQYGEAAENYLNSIAWYEELLKNDPKNVENLLGLCRANYYYAYTQSDWDDAEPILRKCRSIARRGIDADPHRAEFYILRGTLKAIFDETREVLADYEMAAKLEPDNVEFQLRCGSWCCAGPDLSTRDWKKAMLHAKRAVELAPDNPETHTLLGFVYLNRDRDAGEALKHFERAIAIDSSYVLARTHRCRIYLEYLHDYQRALEEANAIVALDPFFYRGYVKRAIAHSNLGNHAAANRDISKANELQPLYMVVYWRWGQILYDKGDYQQAIEKFTKGIEVTPSYVLLYINRARAFEKLEEYDKAIADLKAALTLGPRPSHSRTIDNCFGDIYRKQEQNEQAIESYTKAADADPKHPKAFQMRAVCQIKLGRFDEAIESLSRAIQNRPFERKYRRMRYELAWQLHRYDLALQDYVIVQLLMKGAEMGLDLSKIELSTLDRYLQDVMRRRKN